LRLGLAKSLIGIILVLAAAACSVGIGITNAPYPRECIPGSSTKPCS
jgi:hypothetical protein